MLLVLAPACSAVTSSFSVVLLKLMWWWKITISCCASLKTCSLMNCVVFSLEHYSELWIDYMYWSLGKHSLPFLLVIGPTALKFLSCMNVHTA